MATEHDQTSTTEANHDVTLNTGGSGPEATSAPVLQVQAMVAQGYGPAEIGKLLAANPGARDTILRYLHPTKTTG
jgi:hypothetical protein